MIVILDYGLGNTASVLKAIKVAGYTAVVSKDLAVIENAKTIIVPGVGSFLDAMNRLTNLKLLSVLTRLVLQEKRKYLGICLGMQLLADIGYENGKTRGLGWLGGEVARIPDHGQRIPHMGWNNVTVTKPGALGECFNTDFYFMHSFHFKAKQDFVTSITNHGCDFVTTVEKDNIFGAQFHPEKSQQNGINYLRYVLGR